MHGENKLLIIGIDEYADAASHPALSNAVGDAKRFAQILTDRYGFVHGEGPLYNTEATFLTMQNLNHELIFPTLQS